MASEEPMTPIDAVDGVAAPYDSVDENGDAAHGGDQGDNNGDENGVTPAKSLPSLETMEDLIIEAYNNMQSDGEHIFLPDEVVSKLRLLAQMNAEYSSDDVVSQSSESNQEEHPRSLIPSVASNIHSAASSTPSSPPTRESVGGALLHDVSSLSLDDNNAFEADFSDSIDEEQKVPDNGAFAMSIDTMAPIFEGEYSAALSPVEEVSEDVLSIADLHFEPEPSQETLSPSPAKSAASPSEKPVSRLRKPEVQRRKSIVPPAPRSLTKTQAATPKAALAASHIKTETPPTSRERSSSSYEQRREAAQKLKEEKAQRELQARESARKQREDARRKLEEAQQKEMAAKRERVARMKMQKDRKTPAGTTKPTAAR